MLLLFVHEMGHVIQLRREGIKASAPMFIPFLGAVVAAKSLRSDAAAEARVGLAGPVLGSLGTAALVPSSGSRPATTFWQALAFTGFFLNLFNLLPVLPLDGGRAMAAMAPWMWFVGLAALGALAVLFPNPIILLIFALAGVLDVRPLEGAPRWRRGERVLLRDLARQAPRDRGRLHRADRGARRRDGRDAPGAHVRERVGAGPLERTPARRATEP